MEKGKYDMSQWIEKTLYPVPENLIKNIAHQLLEGINVVHSNHVIHRDLKPSNLVIRENGQIAICDFGSAV
jgi:p38 MAP kinase